MLSTFPALPDKAMPNIAPILASDSYVLPRLIARSAMFGMVEKGQRSNYTDSTVLASWHGSNTTAISGEQLSQTDCAVWLAVVALLAKQTAPHTRYSMRQLLLALGHSDRTSRSRLALLRLRQCLQRLNTTVFYISDGDQHYTGNLLNVYQQDSGKFVFFQLPPAQAWLWQKTVWLTANNHQKLKHDLTRWLYAYTYSHAAMPWHETTISLKNLSMLYGCKNKCDRQIKFTIKRSMNELVKHNIIETYQINNNILSYNRRYHEKAKQPNNQESNATQPQNAI